MMGTGTSERNTTVKVFDFFSGCGGASCGFDAAGMDVAFALDCDQEAQRTYTANFPDVHFELADIRAVEAEEVQLHVDAARTSPVLFCGCAPCQPFTKQNTTRPDLGDDDRIPLLLRFADFIEACVPDLVFVENVPGLQHFDSTSQPFDDFLSRLGECNYYVDFRSIRLMKYGVPQSRRRLVLVASRHGDIQLPPETHGPETPNEDYETVRDWIGHLPPIAAGEEHPAVRNHRAARLSALNIERIKVTPEGGSHRDWPEALKLDCHKDFSGYSDVYGRMSWDAPASGLTTRCISYSNGRFGHPDQDRAISIREAACLQTFPDEFAFEGALNSMARQIGNAVPVRLAEVVGKHFVSHLKDVGVVS
ncbi:MAG: DNA cytosine methyltransferase [Gammaproteobacteria bacterium]|nr:DNA cytosine methyltransferase [Gammaproteobacteria bacterium]